jgi:hypothetical protein
MLATAIPGSLAVVRQQATLAKSGKKVVVCVHDPQTVFTPKALPPPAAEAQVISGKAVYPVMNSDDFCAFPCGPQCLLCPQLPSSVCTKCVDGACTCPDSEAVARSVQGGLDGSAPLLGTSYQVFNYDTSTQTIGGIALSGIEIVTDPTGKVAFGPYPGDSSVCVKEMGTPSGYTLIGHDYACLHLGCGHTFIWAFYHEP